MNVAAVAVFWLAFAFGASSAVLPTTPDLAHVSAIETGLEPAIVIAGRPVPKAKLLDRMRETKTPGVSIAFIQDGRILWARAYGLGDVASGRPVTTDTLFQAASISKPVSAAAALRLVQDGKLNLDEDVDTRLQGWRVPPSAFTRDKKVTLRGLLSHTAGLSVHGFLGYPAAAPLPTIREILNGDAPANSPAVVSDAEPGSRWSYSGGGYVVAQLLMTQSTGMTYPELMQKLVLTPAGMVRSTYRQPLPGELASQAANGYFGDGKPLPGGRYTYPELAPAGLWTTPSDLGRFAIALQNAYAGTSDALLNAATAKLMMTPQLNDFGLGVNVGPKEYGRTFEHGGSNQGFQSEMRAFLGGSRQGIVIMTNGDNGQVLIGEIMRAAARTYGWTGMLSTERNVIALDRATLSPYAGEYDVPGLATIKVAVTADGALYAVAAALGPQHIALLAETPTRFFSLETGLTVDFQRDARGSVSLAKIGGPYGSYEAVRKK